MRTMSSLVFSVAEENSRDGYYALRNMQQQGDLCDTTLQVDSGEKISVHRCVLAARSAYFKAMFTNGLAESNQRLVHIRDMDYPVLSSVVAYCYFSEFSIPASTVLPLLIASDLFQMGMAKFTQPDAGSTRSREQSRRGIRLHPYTARQRANYIPTHRGAAIIVP